MCEKSTHIILICMQGFVSLSVRGGAAGFAFQNFFPVVLSQFFTLIDFSFVKTSESWNKEICILSSKYSRVGGSMVVQQTVPGSNPPASSRQKEHSSS